MPSLPYHQFLECLTHKHNLLSQKELDAAQAVYDIFLIEAFITDDAETSSLEPDDQHSISATKAYTAPSQGKIMGSARSCYPTTAYSKQATPEMLAQSNFEYWQSVKNNADIKVAMALKERGRAELGLEVAKREIKIVRSEKKKKMFRRAEMRNDRNSNHIQEVEIRGTEDGRRERSLRWE
jgi:hypothetical protein